MPAGLPGATSVQNAANPSQGVCVTYDLLSGPKGSPMDKDLTGNASTGALCTGIGFGASVIGALPGSGFSDDYTPGVTKPDGTASGNSTLMYIGGGRTNMVPANPNGTLTNVPYTAGFGIGMAGQGGSRDAGAGPAFTGFTSKLVTAAAGVAAGAVVETGFVNRTGVALLTGQSTFGSASAASAAPAMVEGESNGAEDRELKRELDQELERELEAKQKGKKS